jgi:hypothetical protein
MITVIDKKQDLKNLGDKIVYYPYLFNEIIFPRKNFNLVPIIGGITLTTDKIYKTRFEQYGSVACICTEKDKLIFEYDDKQNEVETFRGGLIIIGSRYRENYSFSLPKNGIILYEDNYFPFIYLSIEKRLLYGEKVKKSLEDFTIIPKWKQDIENYLPLEFLGQGDFATVYKTQRYWKPFAIKMSKISQDCTPRPYDKNLSCWHETYVLKNIITPLLERKLCPNLPLFFESFTNENCELNLRKGKIITPCVSIAVELGNKNLEDYLINKKRPLEELDAVLFQIMAAVHTLQYHAQIVNTDIKKQNIIYYKVIPGGHWEYIIQGEKYYVPNFGKLFILNDFGLTEFFSPEHLVYNDDRQSYFDLGSRYAVVKDGKFVPLDIDKQADDNWNLKMNTVKWNNKKYSKGHIFIIDRVTGKIVQSNFKNNKAIKFLQKNKIYPNTEQFFTHPEIVPPFEFYDDLQDVIRSFIGGKRTRYKSEHKLLNTIPIEFINKLTPYIGAKNSSSLKFSTNPNQVLASYFIKSYFPHYKIKPKNCQIIESYTISI